MAKVLNLDDPAIGSLTLAQLCAIAAQLGHKVLITLETPQVAPARNPLKGVEEEPRWTAAQAAIDRQKKIDRENRRKTTACKQGLWFLCPINKLKAFREGMQAINGRAKRKGYRQIRYEIPDNGSLHIAEVHCPIRDRSKVLWQEFTDLVERVSAEVHRTA